MSISVYARTAGGHLILDAATLIGDHSLFPQKMLEVIEWHFSELFASEFVDRVGELVAEFIGDAQFVEPPNWGRPGFMMDRVALRHDTVRTRVEFALSAGTNTPSRETTQRVCQRAMEFIQHFVRVEAWRRYRAEVTAAQYAEALEEQLSDWLFGAPAVCFAAFGDGRLVPQIELGQLTLPSLHVLLALPFLSAKRRAKVERAVRYRRRQSSGGDGGAAVPQPNPSQVSEMVRGIKEAQELAVRASV